VLLGKSRIPKTDEEYKIDSVEGKRLIDLNEFAYMDLILSIDD
jgi:hypothetical protein